MYLLSVFESYNSHCFRAIKINCFNGFYDRDDIFTFFVPKVIGGNGVPGAYLKIDNFENKVFYSYILMKVILMKKTVKNIVFFSDFYQNMVFSFDLYQMVVNFLELQTSPVF